VVPSRARRQCRRPPIAALAAFDPQVTLRQRSFGSQRFDAFSLLCLPDHGVAAAATAAPPARSAAAPAEPPPRSDDPWHGLPTSVTLHLVPSSVASVTLRATRAADRPSSTS
jgi:hypothetical protein